MPLRIPIPLATFATSLPLNTPRLLKTNHVMVGAWNPAILTPDWLKREFPAMLPDAEYQAEVQVGMGMAGLRFLLHGVNFEPRPERLLFTPENPDDTATLELISDLSSGIIERLPHTPVAAVGHNFTFELDAEQQAAAPSYVDSEKLEALYCGAGLPPLTSRRETHTISFADHALTIAYDSSASPATITFNFHYDTPSVAIAMHAIAEYLHKKEYAESILGHLVKQKDYAEHASP